MKKLSVEYFEKQEKKKLLYYLDNYSPDKVIIIFDHGLGDMVEFLSIFETIQKDYPKWDLYVGTHSTIDYDMLHPKIYKITGKELNPNFTIPYGKGIVQDNEHVFARYNLDNLHKKFKFIFNVVFRDWRHPLKLTPSIINRSKIDICMVNEIGYNEGKKIEPYKIPFQDQVKSGSKNIIYHIGGHTDKGIKNPSVEDCKLIWDEIVEAGYNPIDVHLNNVSNIVGTTIPLPEYIKETNTIRNTKKEDGFQTLINTMLNADGIVGILSGPLHLGNLLYGSDNCLGLQGQFKIHNYIENTTMTTVDIHPYTKGSVYNWLINKG